MTKPASQIDNHFCPGRQQPEGSKLFCAIFGAALLAFVLGAWALAAAIGGL